MENIHPVSTDVGTWYPQACRFLRLHRHHIHSPYEKSIIERTVQYIKDGTEYFDDYFPCRKSKCKLQHVQKWLDLFVTHHNNNLLWFSILSSCPAKSRTTSINPEKEQELKSNSERYAIFRHKPFWITDIKHSKL